MFDIEKNVPHKCTGSMLDFLRGMEIGDSFVCDKTHQTKFSVYGSYTGFKFTTKKEGDGLIRVWRIK